MLNNVNFSLLKSHYKNALSSYRNQKNITTNLERYRNIHIKNWYYNMIFFAHSISISLDVYITYLDVNATMSKDIVIPEKLALTFLFR